MLKKIATAALVLALVTLMLALAAPKMQAVVAALVQVSNTFANPVPHVDVNNEAFQPVNFRMGTAASSAAGFFQVTGITVPAGKRLIVDDVSVFGLVPDTSIITAVWVSDGNTNFLLVNPQTGDRAISSGSATYGYNRLTKVVYNAGDVMQGQIYLDSATPGQPLQSGFVLLNVYVHGHYVNVQ